MSRPGSWCRAEKRLAIWFRDSLRCVYCQASGPVVDLTVDHVDPLGGNRPSNLVTACVSCNSSKKAKRLGPWLRVQAFRRLRDAPRLGTVGREEVKLEVTRVRRRIYRAVGQDLRPYRRVARLLVAEVSGSASDVLEALRGGSD